MKIHKKRYSVVVILIMLLFAACSGNDNTNADQAGLTDLPIVVDEFSVMAEGRIIPKQFVNLSFLGGGQVAEILVSEGDEIKSGQVLARLQNEQLQANVSAAELDLLLAQQNLNDLVKNSDVSYAQALKAVADGRDGLRDAEIRLNNLNYPASKDDLDAAYAQVVLTENSLKNARQLFKGLENKPETDLKRAAALTVKNQAQDAYNQALRVWNYMQGGTNEIVLAQAEADVSYAQSLLDKALRDLEKLDNGLNSDDLVRAEARLTHAQNQIDAAKASLRNSELRAPFAGIVVDINLKIGEQVGPGQIVAVVADLSTWIVKTDNLTEIEVPKVYVGQVVSITLDALPNLALTGTVESISDLYEEQRGDIIYTVQIKLSELDSQLRWGMTVVVTFDGE